MHVTVGVDSSQVFVLGGEQAENERAVSQPKKGFCCSHTGEKGLLLHAKRTAEKKLLFLVRGKRLLLRYVEDKTMLPHRGQSLERGTIVARASAAGRRMY